MELELLGRIICGVAQMQGIVCADHTLALTEAVNFYCLTRVFLGALIRMRRKKRRGVQSRLHFRCLLSMLLEYVS